ncbi:hypothetical protein LQZ18_18005 [Lachnospiraceae bacterium ZAX-1]
MKIAVKAGIFLIGILLTMLIAMALTSNGARMDEMEEVLEANVEQTLNQMQKDGGYEIGDYKEFVADFCHNLLAQVNSNSDIKVEILDMDMEHGILKIRATEKYQTVNGKQKEATCIKTAMLENAVQKAEENCHTVIFLVDGETYHTYSILRGNIPEMPKAPQKSGAIFKHWALGGSSDAVDLNSMQIIADTTFTAIF